VHIGQTAITLGATVDVFIDSLHYPTLADSYKYAAYIASRSGSEGVTRLARALATSAPRAIRRVLSSTCVSRTSRKRLRT